MERRLFYLLCVCLLCSCKSDKDKAIETMQHFLTAVESKDMKTATSLYPQYAELKDNIPYKLSNIEPDITESDSDYTFSYITKSRGVYCYDVRVNFDVKNGMITCSRNYYHPKSEDLFSIDFMVNQCEKGRPAVPDIEFKNVLQKTIRKYNNVIKGLTNFKDAYMKQSSNLYDLCPSLRVMKDYLADVGYEAWAIKKIIHGENLKGEKHWLVLLQGDINYKNLSIGLSEDCKSVIMTFGFLGRDVVINDYPGNVDPYIQKFGSDQEYMNALLK